MKILVLLSLIGFITIAVFGFTGMGHDSLFSKCVAAVMPQGMPSCDNPHAVEMGIFHANAFNAFSLTVLTQIIAICFILAFWLLGTAAFILQPEIVVARFVTKIARPKQTIRYAPTQVRAPALPV